ncbi:LysR family transcriptional regulator [Kaistia geumhonensis]|uniref:DNA-binding transcriptional LysR family regulator n=1 Tax=Kaistia geumhonensis TaxID=410839 RepID=A0ABU0M6H6_9HYPH|nr:LysR family transcriptional regulator [Kaistia geumhonensis]MCX5478215.1 LysR family transcriptional regulator [Kaistia geumhonensis]MDQ0516569.1 DNA-binding transcriptional LysR family regulator [Kaistia geumhonensis]
MSAFMHVHLVALRYFRETVRCGSMRQAAEQLNVAASAINRQILKLEDQMECRLFERLAEGVRLTAAGEVLYRYVLRLERDLDRAMSEIDDLRGLRRGHVSIACEDGIARDFLPAMLSAFHREFPKVTYTIDVATAHGVMASVAEGTADIGIAMAPPRRAEVSVECELAMPIGVIAAPGHALVGRASVKMSDLVQEQMVQMREGSGGGTLLYSLINGWTARPSFIETNASDAVTNLVRAGLGVGVRSPIGILRELRACELVFIPIQDPMIEPPLLSVYARQGRTLPTAGAIMLERIKQDMPAFSQAVSEALGAGRKTAQDGAASLPESAASSCSIEGSNASSV